jgi:hypothetical protein
MLLLGHGAQRVPSLRAVGEGNPTHKLGDAPRRRHKVSQAHVMSGYQGKLDFSEPAACTV